MMLIPLHVFWIVIATLIYPIPIAYQTDTKYELLKRANDLVHSGEYDIAITYYNITIQEYGDFPEAYINRGIAYMEKGDLAMAILDLNKAIEMDPNYSNAYFNRGKARWKTGHLDESLADFSKVIDMNPNDYEAYASRAIVFESMSEADRESALSDYSKALEINPSYSEGYRKRAGLWRSAAKYERAIADYDMAIKTDMKNYKAYGNKAHLLATCPDSSYRDGKEAVRLAGEALELDHSATALGILAAAYAETGEFQMAIKLQEEAISLLQEENNSKKESEFKEQLNSYQAKKPWRE